MFVEIVPFGPDDTEQVATAVGLLDAIREVDSPWRHPPTVREQVSRFRYGWDDTPDQPCLGFVDEVPVAFGAYSASEYDNPHMAMIDVAVDPAHRGMGLGVQVLNHLLERAESAGRTTVIARGWENPAVDRFALAHGFVAQSREINRRQFLAEVDWAVLEDLHASSAVAASGYQVTGHVGPCDEEDLAAVAALTEAINDAPTDDLDVEDEVFPPERIRAYEHAMAERGLEMYRLLARHRDTGEIAATTIVQVERDRPAIGHQHETIVARSHRGHRLGLLLKTRMNLWLREDQPQLVSIDTFNAESNEHMIAVNDVMGYRIMGRSIGYGRSA